MRYCFLLFKNVNFRKLVLTFLEVYMHKLIQIIASLLLCFSLTGCGWFSSGDAGAGDAAEADAAEGGDNGDGDGDEEATDDANTDSDS